MGMSMKSTSSKILASVALVGTAAAVAGMGTYGAFTSSTNASQEVETGTVSISLLDPAPLNVPITGLLPGESVEKYVTLSNEGDSDFNAVTLTTSATTGSLLTSDVTNGLKLTVETCSTLWTAVPNGVDTCEGSRAVLTKRPALGENVLVGPATLTAGGKDYLKITTSLPTEAGNEFQDLSATMKLTFDATQRTGTTD